MRSRPIVAAIVAALLFACAAVWGGCATAGRVPTDGTTTDTQAFGAGPPLEATCVTVRTNITVPKWAERDAGDPYMLACVIITMDDAWPRSSSEAVEGWKQKYATFSRALEEKASACGLDSAHLSRVLETIVANEPDRGVVVLPVAAYQVTLNGELVWFVCRRWGVGREKVITLEHVEVSAFNKRLERVAYKTCG